ncbi:CenpB-DNA-bind-domain-containing protein [Marasmius fiardii PR-910]|nr:CenpB-DNA-bind-domain-containing protein [Marasmius fiardii PR-910]
MSYSVNYAPWPSPADSVVDYPPEPDSFSQTESSIGPTRVVTRGQRRLTSQRPLIRPSSRPQSPLVMPATTTATTYPLTPDSTSYSPYSTYHSRSNSTSNPRSTSPALSISTSISSHSHSGTTNNHPDLLGSFDRNCYSPAASPSHKPDSPVTSNPQTRPKQRKQRLFNVDRQAICQFHLDHPTARQEDIANRFRVERSTISKILKHKAKWLNVKPEEGLKVAKHRPSKFPELEFAMLAWISEPATTRRAISDTRLREKALALAKSIGIGEDKFKASSGWVENFKHRHGIRNGTYEGNGRNAAMARALGKGVEGIEDLIERGVSKVEDDNNKRNKDDDHAYSPISSATHSSFPPGVLGSHSQQHHGNARPSYRRASWTGSAMNDVGMGPHSQHSSQHASHPHQDPSHHDQHFPSPNNASGHRQQRYQEHSPTTYQQDGYSYERQSHASPVASSSQPLDYPSQMYPGHEMQPSTINTNVPPTPQTSASSSSIHQVQQPTPVEGPSHSTLAYPESPDASLPVSPNGRRTVSQIGMVAPTIHSLPPPPRLPDNSPPSLIDAERCLNRVILYLDTQPLGQRLLTPEQRQHLHEIKCILFAAGGLGE